MAKSGSDPADPSRPTFFESRMNTNSYESAEPVGNPTLSRSVGATLSLRRMSWGAVVAGTVIAVVAQLVLSLICLLYTSDAADE
mgnify:CR=1 FL=1